ncbi:Low-density lipoprotein (LDL) receptor class A, conserved site containing protein [Cricetulus griseus]|nr:Low-density lipoprotein (LDL) receptor class A, conserved site containing protein [Cricetulus griseus]
MKYLSVLRLLSCRQWRCTEGFSDDDVFSCVLKLDLMTERIRLTPFKSQPYALRIEDQEEKQSTDNSQSEQARALGEAETAQVVEDAGCLEAKKPFILSMPEAGFQATNAFTECKFTCTSGKCLYLGSLVCNQQNDCGDNSDEENCLLVTEHPPPGIFNYESTEEEKIPGRPSTAG